MRNTTLCDVLQVCHTCLPQLLAMPDSLFAAQAAVIGVDVEHHALRSYLGIVCLLQVSDGRTDYVIDALALHDHMHLLRKLFADPSIVKVGVARAAGRQQQRCFGGMQCTPLLCRIGTGVQFACTPLGGRMTLDARSTQLPARSRLVQLV